MLTSDGQRLSHETHPKNSNVAFWVAAWQYPGVDVGMYGHNAGDSQEFFTYANHPMALLVTSAGTFIVLSCKQYRIRLPKTAIDRR
jgi:hypothetical protein